MFSVEHPPSEWVQAEAQHRSLTLGGLKKLSEYTVAVCAESLSSEVGRALAAAPNGGTGRDDGTGEPGAEPGAAAPVAVAVASPTELRGEAGGDSR